MSKRLSAAMLAGLMLGGCVATRQEPRFDRFDGRSIDPTEFERVKAECSSLGDQAALKVPRNYGGLVGAVDHGINMSSARLAAERACLARNGVRVTMVTVAVDAAAAPSAGPALPAR